MGSFFSAACCAIGGGKKENELLRADAGVDGRRSGPLLSSQSDSDKTAADRSLQPKIPRQPVEPAVLTSPQWKPIETPILSELIATGGLSEASVALTLNEPRITVSEVEQAPGCILGESPHWCAITKSLFYIDIQGKKIHRFVPATKLTETMKMDQQVGFAIPSANTTVDTIVLFAGLEDCITEVNFTDMVQNRVLCVVPGKDIKDKRFNDGKCNPSGRLYAGYMHAKWRDGNFGNVYTLLSSESLSPPLLDSAEMHLPNGSAWIKEDGGGAAMYMIDSGAHELRKYKESVPEPSGRSKSDPKSSLRGLQLVTVVYTLPEDEIAKGYMMDGMTIDAEGKLWVALVGAFCVIRIDPETKKEILRVQIPAKKPTACTFGSDDLSVLYITTRSEGSEADGKLYTAVIEGIKGLSAGVPVTI